MRVLVDGDRGYIGAVLVPLLQRGRARGRRPRRRLVRRLRLRGRSPPATSHAPVTSATSGRRTSRASTPSSTSRRSPTTRSGTSTRRRRTRSTPHGAAHMARVAKEAGRAALPLLLLVLALRRRRRRRRHRGERLQPGHAVRREQGDGRAAASAELADDDFSPTYLRNATAYGSSPRLRADIVVNNLTGTAFTRGEVRLQSDGTPVAAAGARRGHLAGLPRGARGRPRASCTTRRSTSGATRTSCRSATSPPRWPTASTLPVTFAEGAAPDKRDYRVDFGKVDRAAAGLPAGAGRCRTASRSWPPTWSASA